MKTKSKLISITLLLVLAVSIFSPLKAQAAEKIKLNKAKVVLEVDAKITLKLGDIKGTDVKWSSSAKKVATVSKSGVVTAKSEGSATVTATYNKKKYKCKISVVDSNKEEQKEVIGKTEGIGDEMKIKYVSHELQGNTVVVKLELTNYSDDAINYLWYTSSKMYQNGVEVKDVYIKNSNAQTNIRKNATIEILDAFEIDAEDLKDIYFEVCPFFGDENLVEIKLDF